MAAGARPQVGQGQVRRAGRRGLPARLGCAGQEAPRARRDMAGVGGLGQQQVRVARQVDDNRVPGRYPRSSVGSPGVERAIPRQLPALSSHSVKTPASVSGPSSASTASSAPGSA
jgi:hypothetical protein